MAEHETIADIIAAKRRLAAEMGKALGDQHSSVEMLKDDAGRLDAAHRRERGDAAKLREALVSVQKKIHYLIGSLNVPNSLVANRMEINGIINAALAAPPRNCDKYSHDEALQVWASEKGNEHNGCFDEWLYEIAKDGGVK